MLPVAEATEQVHAKMSYKEREPCVLCSLGGTDNAILHQNLTLSLSFPTCHWSITHTHNINIEWIAQINQIAKLWTDSAAAQVQDSIDEWTKIESKLKLQQQLALVQYALRRLNHEEQIDGSIAAIVSLSVVARGREKETESVPRNWKPKQV